MNDRFALLQAGNFRTSTNHRGKISTAILGTCRQINREARHLPLTINELWFSSPVYALYFVTSLLQPSQRELVQSVHLDLWELNDVHSVPLRLLIKELAKLHIVEFGITVMGYLNKDWFTAHDCFAERFEPLKHLETFNMVIGSAFITDKQKKIIVKDMRKRLTNLNPLCVEPCQKSNISVKSHSRKRTSSCASALASSENSDKIFEGPETFIAGKRQKQGVAPKAGALYYAQRAAKMYADKQTKKLLVEGLLRGYENLEIYARTFDCNAAAVSIRLRQAKTAAEEGQEEDYQKLATSIMHTLDEKLALIVSARNKSILI